MKTKTDPKPTVTATTTVSITIQGKSFQMTKEEAQEFAKALVDAVGLPKVERPQKPSIPSKEAEEEYRRMIERMRELQNPLPPIQWPKTPLKPSPWELPPQWPLRPRIIFEVIPKPAPGLWH